MGRWTRFKPSGRDAMTVAWMWLLIAPVQTLASDGVGELSVPPLDHVVYPDDRPRWLATSASDRAVVVSSDLEDNAESSRRAAESAIAGAVGMLAYRWIDEVPADFDPIGDDDIDDYVSKRYTGTVKVGDETRYETSLLIELDDEDVNRIQRRARSTEVLHRIAAAGVVVAGGLMSLMGVGGVLSLLASRRERRSASVD